ncbi:MAG: hypothetical protein J7J06_07405 [Methanosarcinales archaeon]|nr:hypothetical protein [Methanosarcinales archaeon]
MICGNRSESRAPAYAAGLLAMDDGVRGGHPHRTDTREHAAAERRGMGSARPHSCNSRHSFSFMISGC